MSILFCCCPFLAPSENNNERQALLQPSTTPRNQEDVKPESARQIRPAHCDTQTQSRSGRLALRLVCVQELDQRFSDTAETFNEQQERFEVMTQHIIKLRQAFGCNHDNSLSLTECVKRIIEENNRYRITVQIKGYDFSLTVVPLSSETEPDLSLPPRLRLAQEVLKGVSKSAKATVASGTKLKELTGWLLRSEERMAEQVRQAAPTYQEQCRLEENLKETMQEVRRAKELSLGYRKQAGEVLSEAAQIAGAST
ncbi:uncharacterized protein si:ch73-345f18.3 isoform X2 [Hypomesus transpacificus]|uniref:uncharacterized protein si:ch73-345f18.3 isoform X2 n=1 Tax=Hypomesus transpacificus TaxID=137520 RepID=UPI001F0805A1|nr:uncharacterized protein si:ch73-345f18.3 isoform X2 [Hypomesus transpacificus]